MKSLWLERHWYDLITIILGYLLGLLTYRLRHPKIIGGECSETLGPLLKRYRVFNNRFFGLFIHHLLRSDIERDLHDHPWWFWTFLLSGSYEEKTPVGWFHRSRWSLLYRPADWYHALKLEKPVWTLVLVGPQYRVWDLNEKTGKYETVSRWGFRTPNGWKLWTRYKYAQGDECGK